MNLLGVHFFSPKHDCGECARTGGHFVHRSLFTCSLFAVHSRRGIIDFLSSTPSFVSEYSTLGGISAKDSRLIKPSVWSSFRVSDRVFGLMPFRVSIIWLNLSFPLLPKVLMISSAHFLLIMSIMPFSGHRQVWFGFSHMFVAFFVDSNCATINLIV